MKLTQWQTVLFMMYYRPQGVTIREAMLNGGGNWVHKRIGEIEKMGVKVRRVDVRNEEGGWYRRYMLFDKEDERVKELIAKIKERRSA